MNLFEKIDQLIFKDMFKKEITVDDVLSLADERKTKDIQFLKDADTGKLRFIAAWSSNYLDNDYPPDIISESAHKDFINRVDNGLVSYPELWHWHVKGTRWGECDWLAYDDDYGIVWASGLVDSGHEKEAYALLKSKMEIGVSHGMEEIVRSSDDKEVIAQYTTYEISDLPLRWAANKMTTMFIAENNSTEVNMALNEDKKKYLNKVGFSDAEISELDSFAKEQAEKFSDRKRKDAEEDVNDTAEETKSETADSETKEPAKIAESESETADGDNGEETKNSESPDEKQSDDAQGTDKKDSEQGESSDILDQFKSLLKTNFEVFGEEIVKTLEKIDARIGDLEADKAKREKREKEMELEPLSTSIYSRLSAIGSKEAEVEDKENLGSPKEADAQDEGFSGIESFSDLLSKSLFRE